MIRSSSNLKKNGTHLIRKKTFEKKNYCFNCFEHAKGFLKHHQFVWSFEQWNFISNGILKGKKKINSMYYAPLVIQKCKLIVLNIFFTPGGSFSYVCTQVVLGHAPIGFQWSGCSFYTKIVNFYCNVCIFGPKICCSFDHSLFLDLLWDVQRWNRKLHSLENEFLSLVAFYWSSKV
jgi:hypothetical protein